MKDVRKVSYLDDTGYGYVVEYRGNLKEQLDRIDYAAGATITDTLGVVSVNPDDLEKLKKDVPAIIFIESRSIYTLQSTSPSDINNINEVKINPYLDVTGRGVLVGIIDSGINYLNKEFIREDGTSRILEIWDQSQPIQENTNLYIGRVYSNEEINRALQVKNENGDPYKIVQEQDEIGHGTNMAGIIGARGYNKEVEGIAKDCEFLVVKLLESPSYKRILRENNLPIVPVYNNSEVLSAIEYLDRRAKELKKPIVIYMGVGTTEGSHDGYNITARFITNVANRSGVIVVAGTGNLGASEGHVVNYIKNNKDISTAEFFIPAAIKRFTFSIWIQKPNRMYLNVISPVGEETGFLLEEVQLSSKREFYLVKTSLKINSLDPESFTGHQVYNLEFTDIKPGIWTLKLMGEYIINGRYDIWLNDTKLMPEGTRFINSNSYNTLTVPSTGRKIVTVSYYETETGSILPQSGKGFNANNLINPDIAVAGTNIKTISKDGENVTSVSGSSVATAIVTGICTLLLQWAVVDKNDRSLNSIKARSLLIYSANRDENNRYPNENTGYGKVDFDSLFNILSGKYKRIKEYREYYVNGLYVRIPN